MASTAELIDAALTALQNSLASNDHFSSYSAKRQDLLEDELLNSWDSRARATASEAELEAQSIIFKIRESERRDPALFGNLPSEQIPGLDTRDLGGRFLVNKPRIESSKIFKIAQKMPKGAHLHLHFNCELQPERLFPRARRPEVEKTMCIRTTQPLCDKTAFKETEIVFKVLAEDVPKVNVYSPDYKPDRKDLDHTAYMLWSDFRQQFPSDMAPKLHEHSSTTGERINELDAAELWARQKMVITQKAAYESEQTHNGIWACFNQSTRAFKGLVGYEGVYRWYIGQTIESMIRDKVMYAELRPMLMDKKMPSNDGRRMLGHQEQMQIIVDEMNKKRNELIASGHVDKFPFGLKIIYGTPRSIPKLRADQGPFPSCMEIELEDCLKLKLQFPELICGFDLVGAEDRPNSIGHYADLLLAFRDTCEQQGLDIPFLFHAGESLLDTGGSVDPRKSNLYDAWLLGSRRIGHGYAILKHPQLVNHYKKDGICLELCPISNELLHLCGNSRQHPFPQLLAAGLHCTLSADNPAMYSSSLSHEFYQVMAGDPRMTIHGWKQLAQWSLEHSCLTAVEKQLALEIHDREFEMFCQWVVESYSASAEEMVRQFLPELAS